MKKLLVILGLTIVACNSVPTNQEKAENAVKRYLHVNLNSDSAKRMKFTKLNGEQIGLVNGAEMPPPRDMDSLNKTKFIFRKTLYFGLDSTYTKVDYCLVN